jgi:hypothetical protein
MAAEAGLSPESAWDISWAYRYPGESALARGMLSAGGIAMLPRQEQVRAAVVEALAPFRTPEGGYRLENEWHCLLARA